MISKDKAYIQARSVPDSAGCWIWTQGKTTRGYGKSGDISASRVSWIAFYGAIDDGLHVCHKCDVRTCVNPEHLFLGTALDNHRDMVSKGREYPKKRLTAQDVIEIRLWLEAGEVSLKSVARCYALAPKSVREIRDRKYWNWV